MSVSTSTRPCKGVLDLVHLVRVPAGDEPVALVEVTARERAATTTQADHRAGGRTKVGP